MKRSLLMWLVGAGVFFAGAAVVRLPLEIGSVVEAQTRLPALGNLAASDTLALLSDRFENIASKVCPAVVSVEAVKPAKPASPGGAKSKPVEESGSGVIIRLEGRTGYFVISNNHVITGARTDQITLHLMDGRVFRPLQVWTDPETDLALLSIDPPAAVPTVVLGNSDNAKVGRWVLAIGSPFGLGQSVSHGIISARDRGQVSLGNTIRIKEFLQTDAAINPGSSGGPLVDIHGEVIGINTAIASHNGSSSGVAFSIPINLVKRTVQQLLSGQVQRGYLGMQVAQSFEPNDALRLGLDRVRGALVEKTYPDTPAALAGLKADDVILQVDNVAIKNENHLINLVSGLTPGQRVRMQVWRERGVVTLEAIIGDWSKAQTRFKTDQP